MNEETILPFNEWKESFLEDIRNQENTTEKGELFVIKVLQAYYMFPEDEAINAAECGGPYDGGADAIHFYKTEDEEGYQNALVVQGKYRENSSEFSPYQEAKKFIESIKYAEERGSTPFKRISSLLKYGKEVTYVIVTQENLTPTQARDIENIKTILRSEFGPLMTIETVTLKDIYQKVNQIEDEEEITVDLACQVLQAPPGGKCYVGFARLTDMVSMMSNYQKTTQQNIDKIYDKNIRKYMGMRKRSVNDGIHNTLEKSPHLFFSYNNGITIVCKSAYSLENGVQLVSPYIVNGCQTTKTLYQFLEPKLSGLFPLTDEAILSDSSIERYYNAFLAVKIIVVDDMSNDEYLNDITRYSNKQNSIGKKDFVALEKSYQDLAKEIKKYGYFLEIQKGQWNAISAAQRKKYTQVINASEATLFYVAGVKKIPHMAFGNSGLFAPDGAKFNEIMDSITSDDLIVPWLVAKEAEKVGYKKRFQGNDEERKENDHRIQTRYFFLFLFFECLERCLTKQYEQGVDSKKIYEIIKKFKKEEKNKEIDSLFQKLIADIDDVMLYFVTIAESEGWYQDKAAFLERSELLSEARLNYVYAHSNLILQKTIKSNKTFFNEFFK